MSSLLTKRLTLLWLALSSFAMAVGFFNEMKKDLAAQIMRRLEFVKMIPPAESNSN